MNLETQKRGLKKEKYESKLLRFKFWHHCCIWFEQKGQSEGLLRGEIKYFETSISHLYFIYNVFT